MSENIPQNAFTDVSETQAMQQYEIESQLRGLQMLHQQGELASLESGLWVLGFLVVSVAISVRYSNWWFGSSSKDKHRKLESAIQSGIADLGYTVDTSPLTAAQQKLESLLTPRISWFPCIQCGGSIELGHSCGGCGI